MVGEPEQNGDRQGAGEFGFDSQDESWIDLVREAEEPPRLGRLGPYELIAEVSRGGQGIVYRARESETNRLLAVKRMAAGSFASAATRRRFEREIEAAAALNHPNIVSVLGVDQVHGQSILAMEWINGVPITEWCDASRSTADVLRVFIKICRAVNHAHQRGVIHRDLKPSNILVGTDGEPHVLDFGLAKRESIDVGGSEVTLSGQFLGTPAYSSPEHVRGGPHSIDVRSDVYSLGVVLYEIVVGRMPYTVTGSLGETFTAIEHASPQRPSAAGVTIDRDLEAIVFMALAKDPNDRYQSADALGRDVDRFLRGDAVEAKSDSNLYVLVKALRRYRLPFAAAAFCLLLVCGFGLTMLVMYGQADQSARRAVQVELFLRDMLTSTSPYRTEGQLNATLMLERASERIDNELVGHPIAEANVRYTLGQVYAGLWQWPDAEPHLRRALRLYRDEHGDLHPDVASCLTLLGRALTFGSHKEAVELQEEALRIRQQLYGEEHPLVAEAWSHLGFAIWKTSPQWRDADRYYRTSMEIYDRVQAKPVSHWARNTYSYASFNVDMQRLEKADELFHKALRMYETMEGSGDVYMNHCMEDYSLCLQRQRRYDEAATMLRRSIEMRPAGVAEDRVADLLWREGELHCIRGEYEEALRQFERSLVVTCTVMADHHPELKDRMRACASGLENDADPAQAYSNVFAAVLQYQQVPPPMTVRAMLDISHALWRTRRPEAGQILLRDALAVMEKALPPENVSIADARSMLGACLTDLGRHAEAEVELKAAFTSLRDTRGLTCPYTVSTMEQLIYLYGEWGKPDQAASFRSLLNRALGL